jgi:uncharacterized membrane protein
MSSSTVSTEKKEKALDRIVAFSDAVFGFAITLLVLALLEIPRPEANENILESFFGHWHAFLAFLVGFLTIFVCWLNHHHMYGYITHANPTLLWINGFLLLIITFTPLPTAVLAEFLDKENHIGISLFGFTYFLIASFYYLTWSYAFNNGLTEEENDQQYFLCIKLTYRYASIYTFITFWVCFISTPVAIILYGLMFLVFAFPKAFARKLQQLKYKS